MKSEKPLSERMISELDFIDGIESGKMGVSYEDLKEWMIAIVKDCKKETLHPITGNWTNCGQGIRCERCLDFMEKFELKEKDFHG